MKIIPAVDIYQGNVVRLLKGSFEKITKYGARPLDILKQFLDEGFERIHLIDLQGAKEGTANLLSLVEQMVALGASIQVGGGIRSLDVAQAYLSLGAASIILSTEALLDSKFYLQLTETFGRERIILSIDVLSGKVAICGWKKLLDKSSLEVIEEMNPKTAILTDISKDGTLSGVDIAIYQNVVQRFPGLELLAAGGISSVETIEELEEAGVKGVILGKAMYENRQLRDKLITTYRIH